MTSASAEHTVPWCCPLCGDPLSQHDRALSCPSRHSFDIAREGYVNLLPANRKRSRDPGDNREMIEARRRVHAADVYRPLAERLASLVSETAGGDARVLDLGCGEGYYAAVLLQHCPELSLRGVDISKAAVRLAARACPAADFAVASAAQVPLPGQSQDAVVSVFAPVDEAELARLLRPGGFYLKVTPAARHLWSLRERLYDAPRPHREEQQQLAGFDVIGRESLAFTVELEGDLLHDLVAMTPYAYGGQRENKQRLESLSGLSVGMDFQLTVAQRAGLP